MDFGVLSATVGSHYYIILKIFLIDVILYVNIMQQLCISKDFKDSGENLRDSGGMSAIVGEIEYALRNLRLEIVIHNSA